MTDDDTDHDEQETPRPTTEGVRIIGADEAASAMERDDVARRRGENEPKFGDRPEGPPPGGPEPALRFPLSSSTDPSDIALPHWTEPATGQVPRVLGGGGDDIQEATEDDWSSFASSGGPRWRDAASDWDESSDLSYLSDPDETRIGALDDSDRPSDAAYYSFRDLDEEQEAPSGASVFASAEDDFFSDRLDDDFDEPPVYDDPQPRRVVIGSGRGQTAAEQHVVLADNGGRDMPVAVAVGLGLGLLFLLLLSLGTGYALWLVIPVIALASLEFFNAARRAGYDPQPLVGVVATIGMGIGAYERGVGALPAVLFLTTVVGLIWYLVDAGGVAPTSSLGVTLLGVLWVGMFGAFAPLMLGAPDGGGLLLGAILGTVAYDVGGLWVGKTAGSRPLSAASPNKTWEGLLGGCLAALVVSVVVSHQIHPWSGTIGDALKLGLVIAVAAPLGDLCQSLIKRDLGVKDMGTILPGHGGVLDRFDALLFVLPAVYYLAVSIF